MAICLSNWIEGRGASYSEITPIQFSQMNLDAAEAIARPIIKEFIERHDLDRSILKRLTHGAQKFGQSWVIIVGVDLSSDKKEDQVEWFRVVVNDESREADLVLQVEWSDIAMRLP